MYSIQQVLAHSYIHLPFTVRYTKKAFVPLLPSMEYREECLIGMKQLDTELKENNRKHCNDAKLNKINDQKSMELTRSTVVIRERRVNF
jgi:hypothetical protein